MKTLKQKSVRELCFAVVRNEMYALCYHATSCRKRQMSFLVLVWKGKERSQMHLALGRMITITDLWALLQDHLRSKYEEFPFHTWYTQGRHAQSCSNLENDWTHFTSLEFLLFLTENGPQPSEACRAEHTRSDVILKCPLLHQVNMLPTSLTLVSLLLAFTDSDQSHNAWKHHKPRPGQCSQCENCSRDPELTFLRQDIREVCGCRTAEEACGHNECAASVEDMREERSGDLRPLLVKAW